MKSKGRKRARLQTPESDCSDVLLLDSLEEEQAYLHEYEGLSPVNSSSCYRLTRIKRLRIGPARKRQMIDSKDVAEFARKKLPQTKAKPAKKRSRNAGKLAELMNMPVDVVLEITSKLYPLDILHLTRVSKHFYGIFMTKSAKHIWVAARRNVEHLPDCAPDLNEAQYASLMFERNCNACGTSRAMKVDYSLRARFCGSCFDANVEKGSAILRALRFTTDIYSLVPQSMLKDSHWLAYWNDSSAQEVFSSTKNDADNCYLKAELDTVVERYRSLEHSKVELAQFVSDQKEMAATIMSHALQLHKWESAVRADAHSQKQGSTDRRVDSIKAKLQEEGWDPRFFPNQWHYEWRRLVRQPRELTNRIWMNIHPRLVELLKQHKEIVLREERLDRLMLRRMELMDCWEKYAATLPLGERVALPAKRFVEDFPPLKGVLEEDDAKVQMTAERWDERVLPVIRPELERFARVGVRKLLLALSGRSPRTFTKEEDEDDTPATDAEMATLRRSATLFQCSQCDTVEGYPAILQHRYGCHRSSFRSGDAHIEHAPILATLAVRVLDALGQPNHTSEDKARFVCSCGHPRFGHQVPLASMVKHLHDESDLFKRLSEAQAKADRTNRDAKDVVLHNDHDLNGDLKALVRLHSSDDDSPDEDNSSAPDDGGGNTNVLGLFMMHDFGFMVPDHFCRPCAILGSAVGFRSQEIMEWHVRSKHLSDDFDELLVEPYQVHDINPDLNPYGNIDDDDYDPYWGGYDYDSDSSDGPFDFLY